MNLWRRLLKSEAGQDVVEYSLLLSFVVLATAGVMVNSGPPVSRVWTSANQTLSGQQGTPAVQVAPTLPGGGGHRDHDDGDR